MAGFAYEYISGNKSGSWEVYIPTIDETPVEVKEYYFYDNGIWNILSDNSFNEDVMYYEKYSTSAELKNKLINEGNDAAIGLANGIKALELRISNLTTLLGDDNTGAKGNLKDLQDKQLDLEGKLKKSADDIIGYNKEFYTKYSRFIQEGSWIKEDYTDPNLYYMDAESTLYTST